MIPYMIVSSITHAAAAMAASKLQKSMPAGSAPMGLGGAMGALAGAAAGMRPRVPKPKPPGPKDWSPRRQGSCLCRYHAD